MLLTNACFSTWFLVTRWLPCASVWCFPFSTSAERCNLTGGTLIVVETCVDGPRILQGAFSAGSQLCCEAGYWGRKGTRNPGTTLESLKSVENCSIESFAISVLAFSAAMATNDLGLCAWQRQHLPVSCSASSRQIDTTALRQQGVVISSSSRVRVK